MASTTLVSKTVALSESVHGVIDPYVIKVQDGYVYVIGRAGDTIVCVKAKASDFYDSVSATSIEKYTGAKKVIMNRSELVTAKSIALYDAGRSRVVTTLDPHAKKLSEFLAPVQVRVGDLIISVKAVNTKTHAVFADMFQTVEGYRSIVSTKITDVSMSTRARMEPIYITIKDNIVFIKGVVDGKTLLFKTAISERCGPVYTSFKSKSSSLYSSSKDTLTEYVNAVVARAVAGYDLTKAKAIGTFELYCIKVKDGMLLIQGRMGNAIVHVKITLSDAADFAKKTVVDAYAVSYKRIEGYTQPLTSKLVNTYAGAQAKALELVDVTKANASAAADVARTKATDINGRVRTTAADPQTQAIAASAAAGTVAVGTSGGATGLVAGGAVGATCGIVGAPFTFGLSIPIGAAIGSGTGLCVGTVVGGVTGMLSGGMAGYGAHKHRGEIGNGVGGAVKKVGACRDFVKDSVKAKTDSAMTKVSDIAEFLKAKAVGAPEPETRERSSSVVSAGGA